MVVGGEETVVAATGPFGEWQEAAASRRVSESREKKTLLMKGSFKTSIVTPY